MYQYSNSKSISQIFGVVKEVAIAIWDEVVQWGSNKLMIWIQTDLEPNITESIQQAFIILKKVTVAMHKVVKEAWESLRKILLEAIVEFQQLESSNQWFRRLTSKTIKILDSGQPVIVKREVEEEVDWDYLPPEVRKASINFAKKNYEIDFLKVRDQEIQEMSMAN